ncbi:hypothetical protein HDU98_004216, partial [Podochytrium sp. JEL0797]
MLARHIFDAPSSAPASLPLILIHGFLGQKSHWRPIAKQLSQTLNKNVITLDLRNHGDSPHFDSHTHHDLAQDVFDLADHLGMDEFDIVGHSQGGKTAMHMALTRGERVGRLVVVDTTPATYDLSAFRGYLRVMKEISGERVETVARADEILIRGGVSSSDIRRFLLTNLKPVAGTPHLDFRVNLAALERAVTNPDMHVSTAGFPKHEDGVQFMKPCLFIRGLRSDYLKGEKEMMMRKRFPRAEIAELDTGHWVQHEKPR